MKLASLNLIGLKLADRPNLRAWCRGVLTGDYSPIHTDTVLQMEAVECGAACLAMVLGHYGRYETLEVLRIACGVSRDGSKASNIVKAARNYGLQAKGVSAEPADLKELPCPMIVFWNFNHFVVLEGFADGRAWLNDPASGRRSISETEFDASFTGVALLFEPDQSFARGGNPPRVLRPMLQRLENCGDGFRNLFLASLILIVPGLLLPAFARLFVDYYLIQKFEHWLDPLIIGMVLVALLRSSLTWVQQYALLRLTTNLSIAWSARFLWHVLRLPPVFFQQRFGGEIAARVTMNDRLAALVGGELAMVLAHLLSALFFLAVMAQYNGLVTLAAIGIAAINLAALAWNQNRTQEASQRLAMDQGKFVAVLLQGTQQIESLKVAGAEHLLFQRWLGYHAKVINAEQQLGRLRLLTNALPQVSSGLLLAAVLQVGGWQVMNGTLSLGMLVALLALAASLNGPLLALVGMGSKLQEAQAFLRRLDDVLSHPRAPEFGDEQQAGSYPASSAAGALAAMPAASVTPATPTPTTASGLPTEVRPTGSIIGRVCMKQVSFGYSPLDPPLVKGFSLEIEPGQRVAVVGASGSGKSTLGKMLTGLNTPWSGEILLDGAPLAAWPRLELRAALAMVDQEISLFEASIQDNLTLWNPAIPDGWYVRAAKDAMIHEIITSRPGGYAHMVQEGGRNFSAGERQRLEIARALVGSPRLLVLDEATSSLDPEVELAIMQALRRRGITCLIIAHRLSTVRDCDRIVVLQRGQMVEAGSHEQLMAQGGAYSRLVQA